MRSDDPWASIAPPSVGDSVNARRVDSDLKWNFFWARDASRRVLLTLEHTSESAPRTALPRLREVRVSLTASDKRGRRILVFELLDRSLREIFHALCMDIISSTASLESERDAVSAALIRTWRWHHLLRGGRGLALSDEEQRGLIGEMSVLLRYLLPNMRPYDAVSAWKGPLGAPQDFVHGLVAVEVKSRRAGGGHNVSAASEFQFDDSGVDCLYLCVKEFTNADEESEDGWSVGRLVSKISSQLRDADPQAADLFESRIMAAGVRPEDDYSQSLWAEVTERFFVVNDQFPRIIPSQLNSGVSRVQYAISLNQCDELRVAPDLIVNQLVAGMHPDGH